MTKARAILRVLPKYFQQSLYRTSSLTWQLLWRNAQGWGGGEMARVLVIDDDKLFVKLMVHALQERGHAVESASDGGVGLRAFEAAPFDVVVCDMLMPGQEGVETIRLLRRHNAAIRILAISSGLRRSPSIDVLQVAARFGADTTLQKPFKLSQLVAAVDELVSAPKSGASAQAEAARP